MLRLSALPFLLLVAAVAGCSGADADRPGESPGEPSRDPARSIELVNRTGSTVDLGISTVPNLRVHRGALDGSFALPIPDATMRPENRVPLSTTEPLLTGDLVVIADRDFDRSAGGVVLRVGDGPRFLAIGAGTLVLRLSENGTPFFEADDPRALFVLPVDRPVNGCAAGTFDEPFDAPNAELLEANRNNDDVVRVKRVIREANGCRILELGDERTTPIMRMRACVPDELYPFADDDRDVYAWATGDTTFTGSVSFRVGEGPIVTLSRVVFRTAVSSDGGLELTVDADASCARVDDCGTVHTPVTFTARTSDGVVHRVSYGEPLNDVEDTWYVLAGSATPVASMSCGPARASAWVARIQHAK